jgi:hypothetical protein
MVEVARRLQRNAAVSPFLFTDFNEFGFVSDFGFRISGFRPRRPASFAAFA